MKTDLDRIIDVCESNGWEVAAHDDGRIGISMESGEREKDYTSFTTYIEQDTTMPEFAKKLDDYCKRAEMLMGKSSEHYHGQNLGSFGVVADKLIDLSKAVEEEMVEHMIGDINDRAKKRGMER